jgi:hypothetical protein
VIIETMDKKVDLIANPLPDWKRGKKKRGRGGAAAGGETKKEKYTIGSTKDDIL